MSANADSGGSRGSAFGLASLRNDWAFLFATRNISAMARSPSLVFRLRCPRFQVRFIDGNNATLITGNSLVCVHEMRSSWSPADSSALESAHSGICITTTLIAGKLIFSADWIQACRFMQ